MKKLQIIKIQFYNRETKNVVCTDEGIVCMFQKQTMFEQKKKKNIIIDNKIKNKRANKKKYFVLLEA